jgi:hypothetical protein
MNHLLRQFEEHFSQYLTPTQTQTLFILSGLLNQYKQVKIEKLATYFPLPILYESRRKHIPRFLTLTSLSIPLIWFPLIQLIIEQQFLFDSPLVIVLDRTQGSEFWLGLYGELWCDNYEHYQSEIQKIRQLNYNKLSFYQKGLEAMSKITQVY